MDVAPGRGVRSVLRQLGRVVLLCVTLLAGSAAQGVPQIFGPEAQTIDACDARLRARPRDIESYACYWRFGFDHRQSEVAISRLRAVLAREPGNPGALLYLGDLLANQPGHEVRALFDASIDGYRRAGDAVGEVAALVSRIDLDTWEGQFAEAHVDVDRAMALAISAGDTDLVADVQTYAAYLARGEGDFAQAETLLRSARAGMTTRTPWFVRMRVEEGLGVVQAATGRHNEALHSFLAAQLAARVTHVFPALLSHDIATEAVRLASDGELPDAEADALVRAALSIQMREGLDHYSYHGEYQTRLLLALRLGATPEAKLELERTLAEGRRVQQPYLTGTALRLLAKVEVELQPEDWKRALDRADAAVEVARSSGHLLDVPKALLARAYVLRRSGQPAEATAAGVGALEAFDRLRLLQSDPLVRARAASEWAFAYELVAGWALDQAGPERQGAGAEVAFSAVERLRGSTLLDSLAAARAPEPSIPAGLAEARSAVQMRLAQVQRRLLDPALDASARRAAMADLEADEDELLRIQSAAGRAAARGDPPPRISLDRIQSALAPEEALLSFQTWRREKTLDAPYQDGSSWLIAVTRSGAHAFPIPDADVLAPQVALLEALIGRRDGSEVPGAQRLYQDLVAQAVGWLEPSGIRRLVVVPDGPLNRLPFEALRPPDGSGPVGERFDLSVVPSAALWFRWRTASATPVDGPALALADPADPGSSEVVRDRDATAWLEGVHLGALPGARSEAAALVKALGPGGVLRFGADASEHFVKHTDLRPWSVIHFATHAVVDDERPARSAVVLAPGSPGEDGLLQAREIAQLDLSGNVVVLSACRSASGAVLRGEGSLSLARVFFQAGARVVVGSLWPLSDDDAEALVPTFARGLGAGLPAAEAMTRARRERIRAGAPTAAWAGLVVYGDGQTAPILTRRTAMHGPGSPLIAGSAVLLLAGLVVLVWAMRRSRRASAAPKGATRARA